MITLRLAPEDLQATRFAVSPLLEVCCSLRLFSAPSVKGRRREWMRDVTARGHKLDWKALSMIAPYRHVMPAFFGHGITGPETGIESQLRRIADIPFDELSTALLKTWQPGGLPISAQHLLNDPTAATRRVAESLWDYWCVAFEPHWQRWSAVLNDDLVFRRRIVSSEGLASAITTADWRIDLNDQSLVVHKADVITGDAGRSGVLFMPSIFIGRSVAVGTTAVERPLVSYAARSSDAAWDDDANDDVMPVGELIGVTRARILFALQLPQSTTALAKYFGLSKSTVSQHLAVLLDSGLVRAARSGRLVLYQQTKLGARLAGRIPR